MKQLILKISIICACLLVLATGAFGQSEREIGIGLYEKGDYKSAIENLEKAVEIDESDSAAWKFLGAALSRTGEVKTALGAFKKAQKFSKTDLKYDEPLKITRIAHPQYTDEARRNGEQGTIKLAVEFGSDGTIKYIFPINKLRFGLTENAVETAGKLEFKPAMINGRPVTVIKIVEMSYSTF